MKDLGIGTVDIDVDRTDNPGTDIENAERNSRKNDLDKSIAEVEAD